MALDDVQQLIDLLKDAPEVMELSVTGSGGTVTLKRRGPLNAPLAVLPPPAFLADAADSATVAPSEETEYVTATMVGLFHEARPPLEAGAALAAGQVVGAIESMRLMNELTAGQDGTVADVLIAEGQPVEYGQPLFRIRAASPPSAAPGAAKE